MRLYFISRILKPLTGIIFSCNFLEVETNTFSVCSIFNIKKGMQKNIFSDKYHVFIEVSIEISIVTNKFAMVYLQHPLRNPSSLILYGFQSLLYPVVDEIFHILVMSTRQKVYQEKEIEREKERKQAR